MLLRSQRWLSFPQTRLTAPISIFFSLTPYLKEIKEQLWDLACILKRVGSLFLFPSHIINKRLKILHLSEGRYKIQQEGRLYTNSNLNLPRKMVWRKIISWQSSFSREGVSVVAVFDPEGPLLRNGQEADGNYWCSLWCSFQKVG